MKGKKAAQAKAGKAKQSDRRRAAAAGAFIAWGPIKDQLNVVFADPKSPLFLRVWGQFRNKYPDRKSYKFGSFVAPAGPKPTKPTDPYGVGDNPGLIDQYNNPDLATRKWSIDVDPGNWRKKPDAGSLEELEDVTWENLTKDPRTEEAAAMHYEIVQTAESLAYATIEKLEGLNAAGQKVVKYINIIIHCRT